MTQSPSTITLQGGLNLATPAISVPPGFAIASINYEPLAGGYGSHEGFERFDGQSRPSDSLDASVVAARRALIQPVPGSGPVRGVAVFSHGVYAWRDKVDGSAKGMYLATSAGWSELSFGSTIEFTAGTVEFVEGGFLVGGTSGATATIRRLIRTDGAWSGTAIGYLVIDSITGTFLDGETITSSVGSATGGAVTAITMPPGGRIRYTVKNFYGARRSPSMYFVDGVATAYEYTGESLNPIRTGTEAGALEDVSYVVEDDGDFVVEDDGDFVIINQQFDRPTHISHFSNHLFLAFQSGSLINSSTAEPLEYDTTTGAGEISFGEEITGLLTAAATSIMVFGRNRIEYIVGHDSSDWEMKPITDSSGAVQDSVQMMNGPVYLDDGGIRNINTTAAFGDWVGGTLSQLVEKLLTAKQASGALVADSFRVKSKDQYRLLWRDGTGMTMYVGRKRPESMPFNLGIAPYCATTGEVNTGEPDRIFVGADDGYVYEMDRGTSFDGQPIKAYVMLSFNSLKSPRQNKRFDLVQFEMETPDPIDIGMTYRTDYGVSESTSGVRVEVDVEAGQPLVTTALYDDITWGTPVQGIFEEHIDGWGSNLAVTLITESSVARQHILAAGTVNFTYRGLKR